MEAKDTVIVPKISWVSFNKADLNELLLGNEGITE